jgi:hypothetical protein
MWQFRTRAVADRAIIEQGRVLCGQIGAAIPFRGLLRVRPERAWLEEGPVPAVHDDPPDPTPNSQIFFLGRNLFEIGGEIRQMHAALRLLTRFDAHNG